MSPEESIVVAAASVDEAIILGLTRLVATRDEVEIQVLDEGKRGFLGIGAREARVRVTRRRPEPAIPQPQSQPEPAMVPPPAEPIVEAAPEPIAEVAPAPAPTPAVEPPTVAVPAVAAPVPQKPTAKSKPKPKPKPQPQPVTEPASEKPAGRPRGEQTSDNLDRGLIEKVASDVADHLLAGLSVQYSISWEQEDRPSLWISLYGKDANVLVGPRAQTLEAVQYLFRTLLHHQIEGDYNVVLDADGYRKRRQRSLEALARKMADQAVQSGRMVRMKPMPAHERRVIHMVLRKDKRVKTESVGKGDARAITIMPEKKAG
ncbi:MAG TPA: RNA-binding cell elongation regulator Jag/EloR [Anaerolineae bacterium]|nr:RNA-binding cell elongation regulator Jag/EloR [Anaerolineae bacterium]HQK14303.1 RNA-binding cell elongation regulator Jag/EloR [Anaerolineae bacterium]